MVYHVFKSSAPYPKSKRSDILPRRLFMVPLIAAAVLVGSQPAANALTDPADPPGPDTFCARAAESDFRCFQSGLPSAHAFSVPGIANDLRFFPDGLFVNSPEEARLTGVIFAQGDFTLRFSVEIDMSDPVTPAPLPLIQNLIPECYGGESDPINWTAFTTWSGELVGLPGSIHDGARYSITKRHETSNIQFGIAANDKNLNLGMAAEFAFELINPLEHPELAVGPIDGVFNINTDPAVSIPGIDPSCFPPAEPDLTGTWTGTIDCVGFDAEVNLSAKPVENFFSAAVLQIGRSTNLLDVGHQYSVRLTREAGNAQSFCAYAPNNPDSTTGGQGVLVEPKRQATRVHFKFEAETLKARELIADGLHGTQTCKWSFTRTSTTPPAVADACAPLFCFTANECDEDALCGQGPNRVGGRETCTCKDGFVGGGIGLNGCASAP